MLRWRLVLGTVLVVALVGLCWLDYWSGTGLWLFALAVPATLLATGEMLSLSRAGGMRPIAWIIYGSNVLIVTSAWLPAVFPFRSTIDYRIAGGLWPLLALAIGMLVALLAEIRRYEKPGGITIQLAGAALAMVYVGLLMAILIRLRMDYGVMGLASLIIVVKLGDTGAYLVGRLIGRHQLAPLLSPGKTIEGACGAVALATVGAWATFAWLAPLLAAPNVPSLPPWGWLLFGPLMAIGGMIGDLAESLIKRDVGCKDSSQWLPGFGGVLDLLDSILATGPIAYLLWAMAG